MRKLVANGQRVAFSATSYATNASMNQTPPFRNNSGFVWCYHGGVAKNLTVRLDDELAADAEALARAEGVSLNETVKLALTEAVTRLSDRSDPVPDAVWDEAARHYDEKALGALVLAIANINLWNRLNLATQQQAGAYEW